MAKQMRKHSFWQKFVKGVRHSIQKNMEWIQEAQRPHWRPDPDDLKYVEEVMELTYYQREMRAQKDDCDGEEMQENATKRRNQGRRLCAHCPGSWRHKEVIHWCRRCCETLEDAIENTFPLAMMVVFTVLPNVALNKWLSVWPLVADIVFMLSCHNIFLEAFRYALGYQIQDDIGDMSEISEAELLGRPADAAEWHKLQTRRAHILKM